MRNARDSGEAVADLLLDELGELDRVERAGNSQQHDREAVDIELADPRPADLVGQLADLVLDGRLHVQRRFVYVRPPGKADAHPAVAFIGLRGHLDHPRHGGNDLLDNLRDEALHHNGVRAFVFGAYGDGGQLDAGQQIDL